METNVKDKADSLSELDEINKKIIILKKQRNGLLTKLRRKCKHLKLIELDSAPPIRMCMTCGAEERGWYCGYYVLTIKGDLRGAKSERTIIEKTHDSSCFYKHRKPGSVYFVGQSHPNFEKHGRPTYEELTEIVEIFD